MKAGAVVLLAAAFAFEVVALPFYRLDLTRCELGRDWGLEAVAPDFILLVLAYLSLADRSRRTLLAAFAIGISVGFVSLDPWFAPALAYAAAVWLIGLSAGEGWGEGALPRAWLALVGCAAAGAIRHLLCWLSQPDCLLPGVPSYLLEVAYDGVMALGLFPFLDGLRSQLVSQPARKLLPCA